jgi:L-arabinose transport system substrate-binding protein
MAMKHLICRTLYCNLLALATLASAQAIAEEIKTGFLVKQPEEGWFQDEWRVAAIAAKEKGFTILKIGVPHGEKVMSAIDKLAVQQAHLGADLGVLVGASDAAVPRDSH